MILLKSHDLMISMFSADENYKIKLKSEKMQSQPKTSSTTIENKTPYNHRVLKPITPQGDGNFFREKV